MGYYIEKKNRYEMKGFKSKDIRPTYNPVYLPLGTDERWNWLSYHGWSYGIIRVKYLYLIFRYTLVTISKWIKWKG